VRIGKWGAFQDGSRGTLLKVTEGSYVLTIYINIIEKASHSFPDQPAGAALIPPIQEKSPGIFKFFILNSVLPSFITPFILMKLIPIVVTSEEWKNQKIRK